MVRVLLTTVCREPAFYDYFGENAPRRLRLRFRMPRRISFGLRFLRQNLAGLEILEYPTPQEFSKTLKKGWDVVGFSFYLEETNRILRMAAEARQAGVAEVWAGNYGALTRDIESNWDAVFSGYAEEAIAHRLGQTIDSIQHPPLIVKFSLPGGLPFPLGVLFTARGCSFQCTFCQTTVFAPKPNAIPLESLETVIRFYRSHGVRYALILDENFGNVPRHAESVIELLARYGMKWVVQSRVDLLLKRFDDWAAHGMEGAMFGIESFQQNVLKQIHKGEKVEAVEELVGRLHRDGLYAQGYYIIGFPSETPDSIRKDLRTLAALKLDTTQITVVTPHPQTELWNELMSGYGITETDWAKFDTTPLVWQHPTCPSGSLESLLEEGFELCYGNDWRGRVWRKFLARRRAQHDFSSVLSGVLQARLGDPKRLPYFLPA